MPLVRTIEAGSGRFKKEVLLPGHCQWLQKITLPTGPQMIRSIIGDEAGLTWQQQRDVAKALGCLTIDIRGIVPVSVAEEKARKKEPLTNLDAINISNPKLDEDGTLRTALQGFKEAGLPVACAASAINNFGVDFFDSQAETEQLRNFERLLGIMIEWDIPYVRIMSWKLSDKITLSELVKRMMPFVQLAEQVKRIIVHENCRTNGAIKCRNSVWLVEAMDSEYFRLCFDTGNQEEYAEPGNDSLIFWQGTRDLTSFLHVKDGILRRGAGKEGRDVMEYTLPARGNGMVAEVLEDALRRGYCGVVTLEPHTAFVFHDPKSTATAEKIEKAARQYGCGFDKLLSRILNRIKFPWPV
jgi:hypothetical protein